VVWNIRSSGRPQVLVHWYLSVKALPKSPRHYKDLEAKELGMRSFREPVAGIQKRYAVVGVEKSLAAGLSIAAAVLVGVINAAGGGLLRALLVREEPLLFKPVQFCALAVFGGCLLFILLIVYNGTQAPRAGLITAAATFVFRLLAIRFSWGTPAICRPEAPGAATDRRDRDRSADPLAG